MQYRIESLEQMEQLMPLIREVLESGQSVRIYPMGTSMLPMLRQGTDSVVLSPLPETLRKFDIPLYRRDNGKYILHRIVGAGNPYICMGDNQFRKEPGIRRDQMIAVVTAFYRGEKRCSVRSFGYRIYCWVWYYSRYLRYFCHRALGRIRRHLG